MKKICFPATNRVHLARQKLLLEELKKDFEVDIWEPTVKNEGGKCVYSLLRAVEFNNFLSQNQEIEAVLVRGDRYEILGLAMVAVYRGLTIIHIEGGDLSGAIDNKIRYAVTHLSDYHFCTNEESHARLIQNGISPTRVWNFGSLDTEFAKSVESEKIRKKPYIMCAFHPIEGEDEGEVERALKNFSDYEILNIKSNKDYGRQYGQETFSPEYYISLMRNASCLVGNSSSFLKEASIMGVPVVLVGERQHKRLKPENVLNSLCEEKRIVKAIQYQLGMERYGPSFIYYQKNTSKKIANKLKEIL